MEYLTSSRKFYLSKIKQLSFERFKINLFDLVEYLNRVYFIRFQIVVD